MTCSAAATRSARPVRIRARTPWITNSGSTGTIIFNSTNAATFTLPSNITLTQSFNSTNNSGSGQIINDGVGAVVIQGNLTSGATGARNWFLDGTNTGTNIISGIISDTSNTGNTVGVVKEGAGTWQLSGASTPMRNHGGQQWHS